MDETWILTSIIGKQEDYQSSGRIPAWNLVWELSWGAETNTT